MNSDNEALAEATAPTQQTVTSQVTRSITTDTTTPIPVTTFVTWAQHAIFALFGIAFLAWAAAVWNATDLVKRHAVEMDAMRDQMQRVQAQVDAISVVADQASGIHARLDQQNVGFQHQIDRRIDDLQRDIQDLRDNGRRK